MAELWFQSEPELDFDVPVTVAVRPDEHTAAPDPSQTWDWNGAEETLARCSHSLLVVELLAHNPHEERVEAFLPALRTLIEPTRPEVVWLPHCTRVARPDDILDDELPAFVNVRLFQLDDDLVMDTLGLNALGLPDAQCRFGADDHEPVAIATVLYDLAAYILDRGDVIADGDTVGDLPWVCHDAEALVGPGRRVLELIAA
jgi:hypothetical protein